MQATKLRFLRLHLLGIDTKRRIDIARNILVDKVTDPESRVEREGLRLPLNLDRTEAGEIPMAELQAIVPNGMLEQECRYGAHQIDARYAEMFRV